VRAVEVATFEAGVVLEADASQVGHLASAQSRYPTTSGVGGQAGPFWGDLRSPGAEEGVDLVSVVYV
jgi:hypothetical protein